VVKGKRSPLDALRDNHMVSLITRIFKKSLI